MMIVVLLLVTLDLMMLLLSGYMGGGVGRVVRASRGCAQGRILLRSI